MATQDTPPSSPPSSPPSRYITECAAGCGKFVVARQDAKAYLCRGCWSGLFAQLFEIVRSAPEPLIAIEVRVEAAPPRPPADRAAADVEAGVAYVA